MKNILAFDMDGTVADLYAVENWLPKLEAEDASPYMDAAPMWDMEKLANILKLFQQAGWEVRVITWLAKNSSEEYKDAVRAAKKAWLEKWGFVYDHFHGVRYGATKADSIRKIVDGGRAILIDDNAQVRAGWKIGETIDPTACDLISTLENLLNAAAKEG